MMVSLYMFPPLVKHTLLRPSGLTCSGLLRQNW